MCMDLGKLSYYARKIHRFLLLFVIIFGLIQMGTGIAMRYPAQFSMVDQGTALSLHYQTATYFAVTFGLQMLTGIIMHLTPWLIKTFRRPPKATNLPN